MENNVEFLSLTFRLIIVTSRLLVMVRLCAELQHPPLRDAVPFTFVLAYEVG